MGKNLLRQIPNLLTFSRFGLALYYPFATQWEKLFIITVALVTEYLDGFLSRKYHWGSVLGQILDPMADKFFFTSVLLTSLYYDEVSWAQLLLVSFREIVVGLGLLLLALTKRFWFFQADHWRPTLWGKSATACQYGLFFDLALFHQLHFLIFFLAILFSSLAGLSYIQQYLKTKKMLT